MEKRSDYTLENLSHTGMKRYFANNDSGDGTSKIIGNMKALK